MDMHTGSNKNGVFSMEVIYSCIDCIQSHFVKDGMPH